ncbi:MAG: DUF4412 domain-containing protein [Bacteroidota bacterium]
MSLKTILSAFILLISVIGLSAQNLPERTTDRATNRAENRANREVDRSVDKAVDGAIDAVGGLFRRRNRDRNNRRNRRDQDEETQNSEPQAMPDMSAFMGGGDWESYTNPTPFSVDMHMETKDRRGRTDEHNMTFSVAETAFGMYTTDEDAVTRMILDTQTGKVVIVSIDDGETQAMRMSMPGMQPVGDFNDAVEESMDNFQITRTGRTRVIDGYNCEEIVYSDTETGQIATSWVTQDINLSMFDIAAPFAGMSRGRAPGGSAMGIAYNGFPIETTSTDENGEEVFMQFKNIKVGDAADHTILDTSGLEIQDLGF